MKRTLTTTELLDMIHSFTSTYSVSRHALFKKAGIARGCYNRWLKGGGATLEAANCLLQAMAIMAEKLKQ